MCRSSAMSYITLEGLFGYLVRKMMHIAEQYLPQGVWFMISSLSDSTSVISYLTDF